MDAPKPALSTVILNYNRSDLLRITIESYLSTISKPFELIIADNASSDDSRAVISSYAAKIPDINALFFEKNLGGDALNRALSHCSGDLLHMSENDIEYLPGWADKVCRLFEVFHQLGQLSLFGPSPPDDLVWGKPPPSTLRHSKGLIVYETRHNVGATSVIRRSVWEQGIRMQTVQGTGSFRFPDDGKFSADIKKAGYMVAWAGHYLVRNMGHMASEMQAREAYYLENYKSKSWMGQSAMRNLMTQWNERPKPLRSSFLLDEETIMPQLAQSSRECVEPRFWSMIDTRTPEVETLEFLFALVRLVKPDLVVETCAWHGHTACAIGRALRENGKGELVSFESNAESFTVARDRVMHKGFEQHVKIIDRSILTYNFLKPIDLLLLDSDPNTLGEQFDHFHMKLKPGAVVVFQDTAHKVGVKHLQKLLGKGLLEGFCLPTPRGVGLFQFLSRKGGSSLLKRLGTLDIPMLRMFSKNRV